MGWRDAAKALAEGQRAASWRILRIRFAAPRNPILGSRARRLAAIESESRDALRGRAASLVVGWPPMLP